MALEYPLGLRGAGNDFIKFEHFEYQINGSGSKSDVGIGGSPTLRTDRFAKNVPRTGNTVILYMPNSTPGQQYGHEATYQTFPGPFGAVGKQVLTAVGSQNFGEGAQKIGSMLTGDFGGKAAAAYQIGLQQVASYFNADAATAIAIGQGKAFNPNAEMIYKQPYHRKYTFAFDFTPKNAAEARAVDDIIFEFKKWSAPEIESHQFLKIPNLWLVSYHHADGTTFKRMNLFLPSMMTNCAVQDNPSSNFHMTIEDPAGHVPVHTAINLMFQETSPPTREDHISARGAGHYRGL